MIRRIQELAQVVCEESIEGSADNPALVLNLP